MLRSLVRIILPATLALAATACGGDSDDDTAASPTPGDEAAGTQTSAANTPGAQVTPTPSGNNGGNAPADGTYTVQPGDTLSAIAQRFGVTVAAIVEANGIADPNHIAVDQVLVIPDPD